jgi:hypothetical protein
LTIAKWRLHRSPRLQYQNASGTHLERRHTYNAVSF